MYLEEIDFSTGTTNSSILVLYSYAIAYKGIGTILILQMKWRLYKFQTQKIIQLSLDDGSKTGIKVKLQV